MASSCAQFTDLPKLQPEDLAFKLPQTSAIFARDGSLITTLHGEQDRTNVRLRDVPKHVRLAAVAIEDERFFDHDGVDLKAIMRAFVSNAASGEIREGGSTITQQYVKNVIIAPGETAEKTLQRKIDEAALSRQLEKKLTKRDILERYLNTVYFGEGAYGIEAAATTYFGKSVRKLALHEGALLAGLIRSPEAYNPRRNPELAVQRRDLVLSKMEELGWAGAAEVAEAKAKKLRLSRERKSERYAAPYFVDYVQRQITYDDRFAFLGKTVAHRTRALFQGGLKIYTTVDLDMQQAAEDAVAQVLTYGSDPYGALVALDPETGEVRAMAGGRDWFAAPKEDPFRKLNLAIVAEPNLGRVKVAGKKDEYINQAPGSGRQAGSAFKPFALAAGLEDGVTLNKIYEAGGSMTFPGADGGNPWVVRNYEGGAYGSLPLLEATVKSVNVVYAQLILEIGAEAVVELAEKMGINTDLKPYNSAVLGSNPVNALGMANAYGVFATNGMHHPPVAITKIVDTTKNPDKVVYEDESVSERVLSPAAAYLTTSALEQVILRGTGTGAAIARPAAGKTGTAQEYRDAWFVGYTPDLVAAVWVGYPEGSIEMKTACYTGSLCRPTRITVTGGSWPASIWQAFMLRALEGIPASDFIVPDIGMVVVTIDSRSGCLADETTPKKYQEDAEYPLGSEPTKSCKQEKEEGEVEVPDVFGFPVDDAVRILHGAGLSVVTQEEPSTTYPPGRVIGQDPGAGAKVERGSTVNLTISARSDGSEEEEESEGTEGGGGGGESEGERRYVPNVLGYSQGQAVSMLRREGFNVSVVHEAESDPQEAEQNSGEVWKQSPPGGTEAEVGSTVTIWVNP